MNKNIKCNCVMRIQWDDFMTFYWQFLLFFFIPISPFSYFFIFCSVNLVFLTIFFFCWLCLICFFVLVDTYNELLSRFIYTINGSRYSHLRFFYWFYIHVIHIGKYYLKIKFYSCVKYINNRKLKKMNLFFFFYFILHPRKQEKIV